MLSNPTLMLPRQASPVRSPDTTCHIALVDRVPPAVLLPLMALANSSLRYGSVGQALHWGTAILVVVAFIYGPGGSEQRVYSSARDFDRQLHESLGICVLALTLLRLVWRAVDAKPADPKMPRWMKAAANVVQPALYILLLAVPLTAITGAWLEGHPLTFLGDVRVGPWLAESHDIGSNLASLHTWLGDTILWVAGLHATAALFHHYILRDGLLRSMLPGRR
jgi:cytochrome b561